MSSETKPSGELHAPGMKTEIINADEAPAPTDAATVVPIRDTATTNTTPQSGLEVLMLQRNSRGVFGGMWVFPGGQIDEADREDAPSDDLIGDCEPPHGPAEPSAPTQRGFRTAARREAAEEAGIDLSGTELIHLSHWLPPPIRPKRFATHFFVCDTPDPLGAITVDQAEILDHIWIAPTEALKMRSTGEMEFVTPTFVTLTYLEKFSSTQAALKHTAQTRARCFHTEMIMSSAQNPGMVAVYPGDSAYPNGDLDAAGPRRRCYMLESGWSWEENS